MGKRKYIHRINVPAPPITNWQELPVLLDLPTVARLLGKTVERVRRLAASGEIPATKACGEWRIRKDEIMLALGYLPWEIERYGYGMQTARETVTVVETFGKGVKMRDVV
jgi:excisionase family DNA binding protein